MVNNWFDRKESNVYKLGINAIGISRLFLGGIFLVFGVLIGLSLASWSLQDPGLYISTKNPVGNILGYPGALIADTLLRFLGIASLLLIVVPLRLSWYLLKVGSLNRPYIRLLSFVVGIILTAALIVATNTMIKDTISSLKGGIIGQTFYDFLMQPLFLAVSENTLWSIILLGVSWFISILMICYSASWGFGGKSKKIVDENFDEEQVLESFDDSGATSVKFFGSLVHFLFSIKYLFIRKLNIGLKNNKPVEFVDDENWYNAQDEDNAYESDQDVALPVEKTSAITTNKMSKVRRKILTKKNYHSPPRSLLVKPKSVKTVSNMSSEILASNAQALVQVLNDFGVKGDVVDIRPGPVVTLYEFEPAAGVKSSRVIGLSDDIARSMSAVAARVAVISGRNAIGIELPNSKRATVYLRELLEKQEFKNTLAGLPLCLGKTIGGEPVVVDLSRMPHLLIAGTTGSGKSVAINTMLLSLLYKLNPDQCKLIMIDPKMLELSVYEGIPHLLTPVVTDPKKAVTALKWAVREMEDRYKKMSQLGVRNIANYNQRVAQSEQTGEVVSREVQTGFDSETGEALYERIEINLEPMPYIVIIADEIADLMMVAGKDIEGTIQRLAQMARAAGIHLILATQRPSVDVITGTIKANFPTRISFQVTSRIDSRTILGDQGAEQLLGQGDMLYMEGGGRCSRVHGPYVSDEEVEQITAYLKKQGVPQYLEEITVSEEEEKSNMAGLDKSDDIYDQAVAIVLRDKRASTSYIQRRLSIGYNRAATLIERMESEGVVGPSNHAGKREILIEDRMQA